MVEQLELADHDVAFIADFIDYLITMILPGWKCSSDYNPSDGGTSCEGPSTNGLVLEANPWALAYPAKLGDDDFNGDPHNCISAGAANLFANLDLVNPEDKVSQGSVASEAMGEGASVKNEKGLECFNVTSIGSSAHASAMDFRELCLDEYKMQANDGTAVDCEPVCNITKSSQLTLADLTSSYTSLSLEKDQEAELKLELDAIDAQYQQWCQELSRMRGKAMEASRKKWMTRKKSGAGL